MRAMSTRQSTILLVAGMTPLQRRIRAMLRSEGYVVLKASSYSRAVAVAHGYRPDLVLLDMDMTLVGSMTGIECCALIRKSLSMPMIAFAHQADTHTKIQAFDQGIDDFLTEPWGIDELLARIRACLRRVNGQNVIVVQESILYSYDRVLCMDVARRQVYLSGQSLSLTAKEFELLYTLLTHAGKVLTYDFLLQKVWGEGCHEGQEKGYVRVCVCNLRKKIGHGYILTQPRVGYLFPDRQEGLKYPREIEQEKAVAYQQGA
jgi:two-component system KDP operon response regulator KdpE